VGYGFLMAALCRFLCEMCHHFSFLNSTVIARSNTCRFLNNRDSHEMKRMNGMTKATYFSVNRFLTHYVSFSLLIGHHD
jgi:hypothetical protein